MAASTPEQLHTLFADRANAGDLEGLLALYAPDAGYAAEGAPAVGREAVRDVLAGFLAMQPRLEMTTRKVVVVGELALLSNEWRATVPGADGSAIELAGTTAEVARRQPDGTWLYVIDDPSFV